MNQFLQAGARQINLSSPVCMGILNITPDSFSDGSQLGKSCGGRFVVNLDEALLRAEQMVEDGATIIDIGGESTRPGASPVSIDEEMNRVIHVISAIHARLDVCISVDTSTPEVMKVAIAEGAGIVNDVRALRRPLALDAVIDSNAAVCLMHMYGQPSNMQQTFSYNDVVSEVYHFLSERVDFCKRRGISSERIIVDPGFGFGKSVTHNYQLLKKLHNFIGLQQPILVGLSRKSMIASATNRSVGDRLAGSVAATSFALLGGASIIRTHDVAATMDAIRVHSVFSNA